jgi:hypothetical protein
MKPLPLGIRVAHAASVSSLGVSAKVGFLFQTTFGRSPELRSYGSLLLLSIHLNFPDGGIMGSTYSYTHSTCFPHE